MSLSTTLSRVTGFARTWAMGYALGATALTSAYSVANNIPNMIFELVAGGVIASLFIPTFMELRERDEADAWRFASNLFNIIVVVMAVVALLGTVFSRAFVWTQMFRVDPTQANATVETATFLFRFFAVQVIVYGGGMIIQSLLNARRRYLWPALGPVFNNLVVIATMIAYVPIARVDARLALIELGVGTTLGVVAMFAVQIPDLVRSGIRWTPGIDLRDPDLRATFKLAMPTIIYVITNLVAVSVRNASALAVTEKGPGALQFAWMWYQLPYGVLAVALATAVFTELAEQAGRGDLDRLRATFTRGLEATIVLILPLSALLVALAPYLVALFRAGEFSAGDIPLVTASLRFWGSGLVFFASTMFCLRTLYALKDTRTPMLVNLLLSTIQVGLYLTLPTGFGMWRGLGLEGIPAADVIFFALSLIALLWALSRRLGSLQLGGVAWSSARTAVASILGAGLAYVIADVVGQRTTDPMVALGTVAAAGSIGLAFTLGLASVFRVSAVTESLRAITRRISDRRSMNGRV